MSSLYSLSLSLSLQFVSSHGLKTLVEWVAISIVAYYILIRQSPLLYDMCMILGNGLHGMFG